MSDLARTRVENRTKESDPTGVGNSDEPKRQLNGAAAWIVQSRPWVGLAKRTWGRVAMLCFAESEDRAERVRDV